MARQASRTTRSQKRPAGRDTVRLLFSCAGRRVELIQAFLRAAASLGLRAEIHTADADPLYAASCLADHSHQLPPARDRRYIPALLDIARKHRIDLLIPLLDLELLKLARAREDFAAVGCRVLISSPRVVLTCQDKLRTFRFLTRAGIDTPMTWTPDQVLARRTHDLPYFLKPRQGSASQGNFMIRTREDLNLLARRFPDAIIQEFVPGVEHTLDVYTGFDGRPKCVVPRRRIEVRGGEVTKARTVRNEAIIQAGVRVAEALRDCIGLITIQLIVTPQGRIRIIEINPRFGGGVPLAIRAGANFPKWLLSEWRGEHPRIRLDGFEDGLTMLRYHQSFFRHADELPDV